MISSEVDNILGGGDIDQAINDVCEGSLLYGTLPSDVPITYSISEFSRSLKAGDIINTRAMAADFGWKRAAFNSLIISMITRNVFSHTALYLGGGKMLQTDIGFAGIVPVKKELKNSAAMIIRPIASAASKKKAMAYAKAFAKAGGVVSGKAYLPVVGRMVKSAPQEKIDQALNTPPGQLSAVCSGIVAQAYKDIQFVAGKEPAYVTPADIARSDVVKRVLIYIPERDKAAKLYQR